MQKTLNKSFDENPESDSITESNEGPNKDINVHEEDLSEDDTLEHIPEEQDEPERLSLVRLIHHLTQIMAIGTL